MKILQIVQFFSPKRGGSVYSVYNLTKHLIGQGHEVAIFTTDYEYDEEFAKAVKPARVEIFKSYGGSLRYSPSMQRALDQEVAQFDIAHLHNYWTYQNIIAAKYCMRYNVPYVLSPHGSLPVMMKSRIKKQLFNFFFGDKITKNASRVIAVSNMEAEQIAGRGVLGEKIRVIPNAIELSVCGMPASKGVFRENYGILGNEKLVLFLGRIHPIKGLDMLLRSFALLLVEYPKVKLVIAGPDENYLCKLKKQAAGLNIGKQIIFADPLYENDKYAAYFDADVFVLPSKYEIFGISAIEACAFGIPVIITEQNGLVDYIAGVAGEVVSYDEVALSKAMSKLLSNTDLCVKYGQAGSKLVQDFFTWDKIIKVYEKAYQEVLK